MTDTSIFKSAENGLNVQEKQYFPLYIPQQHFDEGTVAMVTSVNKVITNTALTVSLLNVIVSMGIGVSVQIVMSCLKQLLMLVTISIVMVPFSPQLLVFYQSCVEMMELDVFQGSYFF